jgi:hypothetical protein
VRRKGRITIEKARELLLVQTGFGGFYNSSSARLILSNVVREHGQALVGRLNVECGLDTVFGFQPG